MKSILIPVLAAIFITTAVFGAEPESTQYDSTAVAILRLALDQNNAYRMLHELCTTIGPRLSGSPQAARAVEWSRQMMTTYGFRNVRLEPVMVPHWVRGSVEEGWYRADGGKKSRLHLAALGGSVGTGLGEIRGEIVEVRTWDELTSLGASVKGKIVLFNRPMDRTVFSPGQAYGRAVDQRSRGALEAAKYGAVAALVRSMTTHIDDVPHTGSTRYADSIPKIPAVAVSTNDANTLSRLLQSGKAVTAGIRLSCETLPDAESANVLGELVGTEKPEEVIVVGGHLDSWDKGQGAHDDGAGCIHAIEALRLLKELGLQPKRTIRAVMFMNEENGVRGGLAYAAAARPGERHIAAIESDAGGFMPHGFGTSDSAAQIRLLQFVSAFRQIGADAIVRGGGGVDIGPLTRQGIPSFGLTVDGQRYFDYHHSATDVIETVSERELAFGASAVALLVYIIAQEGL